MRYVPAVMIVLALLDGALHFSIDAFVNKTFTNLPYGPLFVALPIGYLILIALFYLTGGRYNPFQLATIAKSIEVVLIVAALVYVASLGRQRTTGRLAAQS
jgi:hypothetical protein